ncbi:MAG: ABC transporter ATP-binding protein [Chloroflexota bacterium]
MDHLQKKISLQANSIQVGYAGKTVLDELSLDIVQGDVTALVGPNGSGKSTLLKTLARLLRPTLGEVYLDGRLISRMATREVARQMAILPQQQIAPAGLTVRELIEQGRFAHSGPLRMFQKQDHEAIDRAIEVTRTGQFVNRPVESLSGGERQRVWIAVILAQDTPILLLDEPTTFLDIGYQLDVLALVEELNQEHGLTIVLVLHDLNQAARYASRLIVLNKGAIYADGPPADVLTAELLADVFRVRAQIITYPEQNVPICIPLESR